MNDREVVVRCVVLVFCPRLARTFGEVNPPRLTTQHSAHTPLRSTIFDEELATAILEEVDKAAAQRQLPLETATHAAQWVKEFYSSYADIDFIIRALHDQELLIVVRFEIEAYQLTREGSSILVAGATLMEQVCAVLLSHPNSTQHELKVSAEQHSSFSSSNYLADMMRQNLLEGDVSNKPLTRALSRAEALGFVQQETRRVMTASGPSQSDVYRVCNISIFLLGCR
jgi:hypothetical protein